MYFIFKGLVMIYVVNYNINIKFLVKKFFICIKILLDVKFIEVLWKFLFLYEVIYG